MSSILQVQSISKSFGGLKAVDHCSFSIEENSITGLIGPNGAGKTTMFDLISGLLHPDTGNIHFKYEDITKMKMHNRAKKGLIRTFQDIRIFPELTVIDNIMVAFPEYPDSILSAFGNTVRELNTLQKRTMDLLEKAKLANLAKHIAGSLSFGQKKILEILRISATGASLLLLDEPAAGVNRTMLHNITELIKELRDEGRTILLVEHDMGFVMELCEKIIVMEFGKKIAEGSPQTIQNDKNVLEAYLGVKKHDI